jgi:hypothetical protein
MTVGGSPAPFPPLKFFSTANISAQVRRRERSKFVGVTGFGFAQYREIYLALPGRKLKFAVQPRYH